MPSEKQCDTARQITGSNTPSIDINTQYRTISASDKFLLSHAIEKFLKANNVPVEGGWIVYRDQLDGIALDFLVSSATAYCIYKDWKSSK